MSTGISGPSPPKGQWVLTEEAFETLLKSLDSDRERAGQKYGLLHERLSRYFRQRRCIRYLDLADETLNRLAKSLTERTVPTDEINAYCFGIARKIALEAHRTESREIGSDDLSNFKDDSTVDYGDSDSDIRSNCFHECLKCLTTKEQELILGYYEFQGQSKIDHRQKMAERYGYSQNALRVRACRLRVRLENCIKNCCNR